MRVGLISDTHDNLDAVARALSELRARRVRFVLHAGDVTAPETLRAFEGFDGALAFGNNDLDRRGFRRVARDIGWEAGDEWRGELGGVAFGLAHGHRRAALSALVRSGVDVVVTGHSHRLRDEVVPREQTRLAQFEGGHVGEGVRVINPGALFRASRYTCAVLDVRSGELEVLDLR